MARPGGLLFPAASCSAQLGGLLGQLPGLALKIVRSPLGACVDHLPEFFSSPLVIGDTHELLAPRPHCSRLPRP